MSGRRNPYVGARPFERRKDEVLYGREREVRELAALLIAERIALLYSPSGAGKTSLIQARLLDEMNDEGFEALPVIRVSTELCPAERTALGGTTVNRYLVSALLSLEEAVPPAQQIPVHELAGMSFDAYLTRRTAALPPDRSPLLIFDQFEEVLTLDPTDLAVKEAFFDQVGAALRNRERWALFAMREDYVGALEPYLRRLPTRLRTTFRLDLLDAAAAQQAIRKPAEAEGVELDEAAAAALIDNLRAVWVQRSDGTRERQPGPYIEPVQLQVVCHRLWERLQGAARIGVDDVRALGDVDAALAGYYAERVAAIASATGVSERSLREWVDGQLITEQQMRGQVQLMSGKSQGLDNRAIRGLVDAHLVREERRRGATWLELAHDRLIEPVKADNAEWLRTHLNDFQRQAALWAGQGRPDGLLLHGRAAEEAEAWAGAHAAELTAVEREFLAACRKARQEAQKDEDRRWAAARLAEVEREKRRIRRLAYVAAALALVAVAMAGVAFWQRWRAEQATADAVAAQREAERVAEEKDQVVEALQLKNRELQYRTAQLVEETRKQAVPLEQVAVAGREAEKIAAQDMPGTRGEAPIRIQYFAKDHDEDLVRRLEERGFRVRRFAGGYDVTNTIWYGTGIGEDELRLLALTLVESGVKVQQVTPFKGKKRPRVVSLGTDPNWLTRPLVTVEQLKELAPDRAVRLQLTSQPFESPPPLAYEPPR